MKTILHLNSSIFGEGGQSSRLAEEFVAQFPAARVITRDLGKNPLPHLDAERFGAFLAKPDTRTPEQQRVLNESDALIAELRQADTLVLGLPMYNFGVPSTLKAYFDHVARAGVTFRYTEQGPVGLLAGKQVYVFATRGGMYAGTPRDTQTNYLRDFLGFLAMDRVEFVFAEGLALGEEHRNAALEAARAGIERLTTPELLAA